MQIDMGDAERCFFWLGHDKQEECRVGSALEIHPKKL